MPVLANQLIPQNVDRSYHIHVPANPTSATAPAIIVFHGSGQDAGTIATRWGLVPGNPVPASVEDYLLVFPEAHPLLAEAWMHYRKSDSAFPTLDLEFVESLLQEITSTSYATGSMAVPTVSADPDLIYAAGFSNGAGMVWQLMNSGLVSQFRGFATVGKALDPEKSQRYRRQLAASGQQPPPVPVMYIHGTADSTYRAPASLQEVPVDTTFPGFTVREMLTRNGIAPSAPAASTTLVPGATNLTEVVVQTYLGSEAFANATVINGGHNWSGPGNTANPPVATHFDATDAILDFWHTQAGLP